MVSLTIDCLLIFAEVFHTHDCITLNHVALLYISVLKNIIAGIDTGTTNGRMCGCFSYQLRNDSVNDYLIRRIKVCGCQVSQGENDVKFKIVAKKWLWC